MHFELLSKIYLFIMKKTILFMGLAVLLLAGCSKGKTCRCAILPASDNSNNANEIRIINIDRGDCKDINFVFYDRNGGVIEKDQDLVDSVLCTDHQFPTASTNK